MSEMLKCLQCGKFTYPGPAKCDHCGASLRGAPTVDVTMQSPTVTGGSAVHVPVSVNRVVVTDIDMPFGSMVRFMVKWAIASIPAFVILFIIGMIVTAMFAGMFSQASRF